MINFPGGEGKVQDKHGLLCFTRIRGDADRCPLTKGFKLCTKTVYPFQTPARILDEQTFLGHLFFFSFFSFPFSIVFFPFSFVMGKSFFGSINKKEKETSGERSPTVSDVDSMSIKHAEPGTGSQFKEFIKTVISFTGDLSSLTCPAFFLNGLSLLEYG